MLSSELEAERTHTRHELHAQWQGLLEAATAEAERAEENTRAMWEYVESAQKGGQNTVRRILWVELHR